MSTITFGVCDTDGCLADATHHTAGGVYCSPCGHALDRQWGERLRSRAQAELRRLRADNARLAEDRDSAVRMSKAADEDRVRLHARLERFDYALRQIAIQDYDEGEPLTVQRMANDHDAGTLAACVVAMAQMARDALEEP